MHLSTRRAQSSRHVSTLRLINVGGLDLWDNANHLSCSIVVFGRKTSPRLRPRNAINRLKSAENWFDPEDLESS